MSIDLHLSLDSTAIARDTYSVFDLFGDVGGLMEIIRLFFALLAVPFSKLRLDALVTNRLYHVGDN
jgi:hypothetical protein